MTQGGVGLKEAKWGVWDNSRALIYSPSSSRMGGRRCEESGGVAIVASGGDSGLDSLSRASQREMGEPGDPGGGLGTWILSGDGSLKAEVQPQ